MVHAEASAIQSVLPRTVLGHPDQKREEPLLPHFCLDAAIDSLYLKEYNERGALARSVDPPFSDAEKGVLRRAPQKYLSLEGRIG